MEAAEQFAYIGLGASLMLYLTNAFDEPLTVAAKNRNTWVGVSSIFPLLGGFIADSYLGTIQDNHHLIPHLSLGNFIIIFHFFFYHIVVGMFVFIYFFMILVKFLILSFFDQNLNFKD
jgi:hypothetical protein